MQNKSGISLVALVVTIIVMSIIAVTIILQLSHEDVLMDTKETKFKEELYKLKEQVETKISNITMEKRGEFDRASFSLSEVEIQNFVEDFPETFVGYAKIKSGELILNSNFRTDFNPNIVKWCYDVGVKVEKP